MAIGNTGACQEKNRIIIPVIDKLEECGCKFDINKNKIVLDAPRKLRKSYIWSKKVRLAVYKLITYLPKLISGNYKRKIIE